MEIHCSHLILEGLRIILQVCESSNILGKMGTEMLMV